MNRVCLDAVGMLGCCLLLACSSSPPMRYYTLNDIASATPLSAAGNQIAVRVEPVIIPSELDRLELVSHSGPNRVRIADSDRWAAPLEDQIRRIVSDDLSTRLPAHWVSDPNEPASAEPRRLLSITIAEFYGDETCAVTLRANWTLRNSNAGSEPNAGSEQGTEQVQIPGIGPCVGALPAAMSRALAVLSDRLAAVIVAGGRS